MTQKLISVFLISLCTQSIFAAKELPWQKSGGDDASNKSNRPTPQNHRPRPVPSEDPKCQASLTDPNYIALAKEMSDMASDTRISNLLEESGLTISDVSWQDTGRSHMSAGGSNISDVRLMALTRQRGEIVPVAQPIIRLPNFEDKTVDVDMDKIFIPVGNSWGVKPFAVSLKTLLEDLPNFLTAREAPKSSLYDASRDSQVLVSAQASIMPVPKDGEATFVPSIFNYQSTAEHPAVLVILVSNRGTSVTVIDNKRDPARANGFSSGGQLLFHNKDGEKAPFTLESLKEVTATKKGRDRVKDLKKSGQSIAGVSGVNQVLMIQVPLKYPPRPRRFAMYGMKSMAMSAGLESATRGVRRGAAPRGLDTGVVDVAKFTLGKYVELDGKGSNLERDTSLPIRVDVVRYMASDTTDLTGAEVASLPEELRAIYEAGENLGSLVTDDDYTRITRNYKPWTMPWWKPIVIPYIPIIHRPKPWLYFANLWGPNWMYRFATEEAAHVALRGMEKAE